MCSYVPKNEAYVNIRVWNGYSFFTGVLDNDVLAVANDAFKVYTGLYFEAAIFLLRR